MPKHHAIVLLRVNDRYFAQFRFLDLILHYSANRRVEVLDDDIDTMCDHGLAALQARNVSAIIIIRV